MAALNLEEIDLSMDKVLREYPSKILPEKFNKRTGKAKNCLYENIDTNLYEKEMLTFHTSIDRIHSWIKTLDVFYYDFLGANDNLDIKWQDDPEVWTDRNCHGNSIVIEVWQAEKL